MNCTTSALFQTEKFKKKWSGPALNHPLTWSERGLGTSPEIFRRWRQCFRISAYWPSSMFPGSPSWRLCSSRFNNRIERVDKLFQRTLQPLSAEHGTEAQAVALSEFRRLGEVSWWRFLENTLFVMLSSFNVERFMYQKISYFQGKIIMNATFSYPLYRNVNLHFITNELLQIWDLWATRKRCSTCAAGRRCRWAWKCSTRRATSLWPSSEHTRATSTPDLLSVPLATK